MEEKIRVLFLAADPFRHRARLRLHTEVHVIERASARQAAELIPCFAASTVDLQHALLQHDPRIVHFAGRGDGGIRLADATGRPGIVGEEALATMFGFLSEWVKVVILSGCGTLRTVEALSGAVDYAIGMNQPLGDPSAVGFARAFYDALGMGKTVRASFELAVAGMALEGNADAPIPVLRIGPGVDPSVPLVAKAALPSPAPAGNGAKPTRLPDGRVITFGKLRGDRPAWENRPGSEAKGARRIAIGHDYVFRDG